MSTIIRNNPLFFAAFAWKNFEFIEKAAIDNAEIHPVTELVLSLLALIVFQHEKNRAQFNKTIRGLKMASLPWPVWHVSKPNSTLGEFIRQLRHTIAHGGITFSSNSHNLADVEISFHDPKSKWTGRITGDALREFCYHFKRLLEKTSFS